MVEITVKAADSASAMEEIEKRLGADAMIVSTNRIDGQIEIVATNDDPSKYKKTPEPLVLDQNYKIKGFSDCLLYTSPSPRDMRRSRMPSSA